MVPVIVVVLVEATVTAAPMLTVSAKADAAVGLIFKLPLMVSAASLSVYVRALVIVGLNVTLKNVIAPVVSVTLASGLKTIVSPLFVYVPVLVKSGPLVPVMVIVAVPAVRVPALLMVAVDTAEALGLKVPPEAITSAPVVKEKLEAETVSRTLVALLVLVMVVVPVTVIAAPNLTVSDKLDAAVGLISKLLLMLIPLPLKMLMRLIMKFCRVRISRLSMSGPARLI